MLTLADFFCGAGGSSTGALMVPGVELRAAANHWDRAIETHAANHPDADHIQADTRMAKRQIAVGQMAIDVDRRTPKCWAICVTGMPKRGRPRKGQSISDA